MIRCFLNFATSILLSCQEDDLNADASDEPRPAEFKMLPEENCSVILATTPLGHTFHFMPIYEPGVTDITIMIAWPSNWAYEASRNPAVPYIGTETLLSGGMDDISPKELNEFLSDRNSGGSLIPSADYVYGEINFPKDYREEVIKLASDTLRSPKFDPRWVHRIKGSIRQNMQSAHLKTETKIWNLARKANLGDSPLYHFLTLPDPRLIDEVSVNMLRQWHEQTFTQSGLTIVVTGAISRQDAGKSVDILLSDLPKGRVSQPPDINAKIKPQTVFLHVPEAEKTTIGILGRLPPTSQGNDLTDLLALSHFSQNGSGPLFSALYIEQRASYGFQAGFFNYNRKNRLLFITGAVAAEQAAEVAADIPEIYEEYRLDPNFETLADLRNGMVNQTQKNVTHVNIVAQTILELALDKRDPKIAPKLHNELAKLHSQDLKSRMKTVVPPKSELAVFAAGPSKKGWSDACVISKIEALDDC